MSKVFVFCIGGTGIRVMKSITMLMAGGMSTNGYTVVPVIVDPHLDLEEKKNLHALLDVYKEIHWHGRESGLNPMSGFFNAEIELLDALTGAKASGGTNQMYHSYIDSTKLGKEDINHFLLETLFSTKNMNSSLSVGFKGNPNMGTVVLGNMIEDSDWFKGFKQQCEKGDRVFIISSIFGGTGASGYPLVEKKIKMSENTPAVKDALMGAVTVLPYYRLSDPDTTSSDIDSTNFYTKTKAALTYYKNTVKSEYLYYVGEQSLETEYDNDENKQNDKAHFIELVAASALFDFLKREKPEKTQYLSRAINEDKESMDFDSLGKGYSEIVKSVADYMLLCELIKILPSETYFPLKKTHGLNEDFYNDSPFHLLQKFKELYVSWYGELSTNSRAFAPLKLEQANANFVKGLPLGAKDITYYLLEMIKSGNKDKNREHNNKLRFFLEYAYKAIDKYTKEKIK